MTDKEFADAIATTIAKIDDAIMAHPTVLYPKHPLTAEELQSFDAKMVGTIDHAIEADPTKSFSGESFSSESFSGSSFSGTSPLGVRSDEPLLSNFFARMFGGR